MIIRKYMFGAGAWASSTSQEKHAYESTYMGFMLQCCFAVSGFGGAGLTDVQVCSLLGVLEPADALTVERARYLCQSLQHDTQKTQNPEGQRKGTSKDLYRPYLRPKPRGVSTLFFLEPNDVRKRHVS